MGTIDLDAQRAARREALGDPPVVRHAGRDWQLPVEMPFEFAEVGGADPRAAVAVLLGDNADEFFAAARLSVPDLEALVKGLLEEYGIAEGEAPPSGQPSPATGGLLRATSNGGTASTSVTPVGGATG